MQWCLVKSFLHTHPCSELHFQGIIRHLCHSCWSELSFLVSCLSIKRSVRMSTQSRLAWLVWFLLALPCCQTQFPAEGFGLMKMQWVRGHYPSETCLKCCCSPHCLDWWHLQHCCSLSTDKGSGWKKKKKVQIEWLTSKHFHLHKTYFSSQVHYLLKSSYPNPFTELCRTCRSYVKSHQRALDLVTFKKGMERNV